MLFFPGWDVTYAKEKHITEEVNYLGGIVGGGFLVSVTDSKLKAAANWNVP